MMKKMTFIVLALIALPAHAEVFKCELKSGKTVYQSLPCESAVKQEAIDIQKVDPRKVSEEEAKLKTWKEDYAKREQERIKAEKEQQAELDRKASLEALKKSAEYQQQQAREAKRQADAMERQRNQPANQPYQFYPYYPAYQQPAPTFPFQPPQQQNMEHSTSIRHQPRQNDLKPHKDSDSDLAKPIWNGK